MRPPFTARCGGVRKCRRRLRRRPPGREAAWPPPRTLPQRLDSATTLCPNWQPIRRLPGPPVVELSPGVLASRQGAVVSPVSCRWPKCRLRGLAAAWRLSRVLATRPGAAAFIHECQRWLRHRLHGLPATGLPPHAHPLRPGAVASPLPLVPRGAAHTGFARRRRLACLAVAGLFPHLQN